jgi:hypothetical protein
MSMLKSMIRGVCVAAMANAAGISYAQPAWWVFLVAGCVLVAIPQEKA